ncbi:MAG: hypothetical protein RI924_291 [Bacteroidota bacterium]
MKKLFIYVLLLLGSANLQAQDKSIRGIVFDLDSKIRLTRVYIYNTRTASGFYNNTKGEFKTAAQKGDVLTAKLEGYRPDTVKVGDENDLVFYLKRNSIRLKEVVIKDTLNSPARQLQEIRENYRDIYRRGNVSDIFTFGGGSAGLGIDALYNLFSRQGKNARLLQKEIDRDYKETVINYRYTPLLVLQVTGLSGAKLKDFMQQYRPSYTFILEANEYELVRFIQVCYQQYLKNPAAYRLPPLKQD